MKIPSIPVPERRLMAGVAIGILVGVLGVGAVTAASPSPSNGSGASGTPAAGDAAAGLGARPGLRLAALRHAISRNFRVDVTATNSNGTRNILYVRGTLDVSPDSVTVTLPDNSTQTFKVNSLTVVRAQGETVAYSTLTDGDRAMVFGAKNADGSYTAKLIRCVREPAADDPAPASGATP